MEKTTLVNVKRDRCDVFIGRGSFWGNPFTIGVDGSRTEVIEKYLQYVLSRPEMISRLKELSGKRLGCFCWPNRNCHGQVLIDLIEDLIEKEFR